MPIRLLQVARPAVGGMAGHIHAVCNGLDPALYQVTLACPSTDLPPPPGVQHMPLPVADRISLLPDLHVWHTLHRVKRQKRYDLVHAHGLKAALLASLAFRTQGSPPLVVTLHNSLPRAKKGTRGLLQDAVLRWVFRPAIQVVVVSAAQAQDLTNRRLVSSAHMTTIHNGIPLNTPTAPLNVRALRNDLRIPNECFVVLMVGRMIAAKGVATLLAAASSLVKTGPYVFLLAGDGPDLTQFKELAHSMAIAEHIRFLGFRQDILALLQAADVFVLPSLSEGLPLSVLEAMAAARPVIATRVGGLPELIRNGVTGLLVNPGNAEELSLAIQTLAADQAKRITMGKVGRQVVEEQFTEVRMLDELNTVYANVLGRTHIVPVHRSNGHHEQ